MNVIEDEDAKNNSSLFADNGSEEFPITSEIKDVNNDTSLSAVSESQNVSHINGGIDDSNEDISLPVDNESPDIPHINGIDNTNQDTSLSTSQNKLN